MFAPALGSSGEPTCFQRTLLARGALSFLQSRAVPSLCPAVLSRVLPSLAVPACP